MKTDDLVLLLSAEVKPLARGKLERSLLKAVAMSGGIAALVVAVTLGVRGDLGEPSSWSAFGAKLLFTGGTLVLALALLVRYMRPGDRRRVQLALVAAPLLGIMILAAGSLLSAPTAHWDQMVTGRDWVQCLISIPVIALVPFALITWAVRKAAPTDLVGAGALAGLLAGTVSAVAYSLHCADDTLPFVAVWYGGTLALCTLAGAVLGPKTLRW
jgi:hypothetical protein